jgi:hypothetical protein
MNMARMNCVCGNVLSTVQAPNNIQLWVYTDKEWDAIMDCETLIPWEIPLPTYDVWMCPKCKRLYVFEKGNDTAIMTYVLENTKHN